MSSKPLIMVAVSAFLILALGFGWYGFQSARRNEALLAAFNEEFTRMDMSGHQTVARINASQESLLALQAKIKDFKSRSSKSATAQGSSAGKDPATLMESNPELRTLYLKSFRANLVLRYKSIYQSLTPAQVATFEKLAMAQADDIVTMHAAALEQGISLSDPGLTAMEKQSNEQFYAAVADEVGVDVSQQVIQLDRMQDAQDWVVEAGTFIPPGTQPLTILQVNQLAQILANASAGYQNGGDADTNSINWDNVIDQAATLLSGPQFQAFKASVDDQKYININRQFNAERQAGMP